jgi:acyl-[acyl-carrier-protein]-phospholipid O-acyltransferase/long-chain-fatty-acid--[acyl-carrier-protein] ligase
MIDLLKSSRFLPLFIAQFFGAFNDNLFKNALVILITYVVAEKAGMNAQLMVTLAAGLFMLPFFLFSATAGKLADKYEKSALIRRTKVAEIILMLAAVAGLYLENIWLLLAVLFLLGTQSAFFGPLKYSILPTHLKEEELIGGNALIETGTFLAILLGTILGGLMILAENGLFQVSLLMVIIAIIGWWASRSIPVAKAVSPQLKISANIVRETWGVIQESRARSDVFLSIIGISWFWFVGATFLAQFPTFAKDTLFADEQVVTLFLAIFSIGIGIGSMLCNRLLKGEVTGSYAAPAALGMACFTITLYFCADFYHAPVMDHLTNAGDFLKGWQAWGVLISLLLIAICGGIYIVPLYAIMQARTDKRKTAQVIAGNNIINALFMVLSALFTLSLLALHWEVTEVFLLMGIINFPIAALVRRIVIIEQAKRKGISHA